MISAKVEYVTGLELKIPVIAVLGRKKSGKTRLIEVLIKSLRKEGYRVASGKHVHEKFFSIDKEGTDTWRHKKAGANKVLLASDSETSILVNRRMHSLQELLAYADDCDVLVLEGFSSLVLKHPGVGKIVCFKSEEERIEYKSASPLIGYHSFMKNMALDDKIDSIVEKALNYIRGKGTS